MADVRQELNRRADNRVSVRELKRMQYFCKSQWGRDVILFYSVVSVSSVSVGTFSLSTEMFSAVAPTSSFMQGFIEL